jgi:hypothetical protein
VNYGISATSGNITVKGNNSCGDGTVSTLAITVNPLPVAAATITGSATVCQGQNSVTYTVPSITNATSYVWTLPSGATGTSTTNSITVNYGTSATSGNITVKGTNSCGNGDVSTLVIFVVPLPLVNAGADTIICQGESITLIASGVSSYTWNNNVTNNVSFTPSQTNTYVVLGTDTNGCQNSDSIQITVNPLPNVNAGIDQAICQGDNSTLNASGTSTYTWNNNVTDNISFTPTSTNNYVVIGTDENGCQDSDTVQVTVNPTSTSQLTQTAVGSYTLNGQTYTQSGTYTQVLQNSFGCDSTITLNLTINTSGLSEINSNEISIAPNPTTNLTTLTVSQEFIGKSFSIADFAGRIVLQGKIQSLNQTIDLQKVARGSYFLAVENTNLPGFKIIKE